MVGKQKRDAIIVCDMTSADNAAMALAATRPESPIRVIAIFITSRAAHTDTNANTEERQDQISEWIRCGNSRRMAGLLQRAGRNIPVFHGVPMRFTRIRTVIPHGVHVNEMELYDLHDDRHNTQVAGGFREGLEFLRRYKGKKLFVLAGGPLTELAFINLCSDVAKKLGPLVVQAGDFGQSNSSNLLGGAGNSFNGACDPVALDEILASYNDDVYLLPSNITKADAIGFASPSEMEALGIQPELLELYQVHYEHTAKRRGTKLFIHDLGLVMLAEQILRVGSCPYEIEAVDIADVPYSPPGADEPEKRGTIVLSTPARYTSNRFCVVAQDTERYRDSVQELLKS